MARWLLILVYLSAALSGSAEAVVCIGEDGHVQIEATSDDCCVGAAVADRGMAMGIPLLTVVLPVEDCGHCIDIPLKGAQSHISVRTANMKISNVFFAFAEVVRSQDVFSVNNRRPTGDSLNESCLYDHSQSLRTVCLLI